MIADSLVSTLAAARHRPKACWLALAALLLALLPAPARAEGRRVAVVAGVADYGGRGNLPNPVRDAREMGAVLARLGFEVRVLAQPKTGEIEKAFADFAGHGAIDQLAFYFAGHGASFAGQSVLALNDGGARKPAIVALPLADVMTAATRLHPKATLVMLEACRTDAGAHLPGSTAGLAPPPRATGSFFAYAAAPGDVALDDGRANTLGPFTLALADELLVPNQDIAVVMRKVRERVATATGGRQLPWTEDSLTGPMILNQGPAAPQLSALYGRALKGDRDAERDLGLAYLNGQGVERDVERGLALLGEAAAQKDVSALLSLGDFEAARDASTLFPGAKARAWYAKAVDAGSTEASYKLAELDRRAAPPDLRPAAATLDEYRRAARGGNLDARARYLALNLQFGFDKTLDRAKTVAALRPLAAAHDLVAIATLGEAYSEPGKTRDFKEADFWLDRAVAAGSTDALLSQAKNFGEGRGRPADAPKAYALTLEAAQRGNARAMLLAGRMLQQGNGVTPDPAGAVGLFRKAAEAGETEAFADLGFANESGLGVDRDLGQAVALYRRGAALNGAVSTRYLAVMYENGTGVHRNMDQAIALYQRAADLGDVRAKASLAVLSINGMIGSIPDFARGAALLKQAVAGSDDGEYILKLAQMTEQGRGMKADVAEAARLYRRAADSGSAEALTELATLTLEGKGVAKDPAKAKAMYAQAATAGDPVAYSNLAALARNAYDTTHDKADLEEAGRWTRRGAEAGERTSMSVYGGDLLLGAEGVEKDPEAGLDWIAKSVGKGNPTAADRLQAIVTDPSLDVAQSVRDGALLRLGRASRTNGLAANALTAVWQVRLGRGFVRKPEEALKALLSYAPERGMAALLLGVGYAEGRIGGAPDPDEATRFLKMAAAAGEAQAYQTLGDLQLTGRPGTSPEQAFAFYRQGADAGDPGAINDLGFAYAKGIGTPVDLAKSFAAFKRAADMRYAPAMWDVALSYERGAGTPPSLDDAEIWYQRGVDAGDDRARFGLASVLLKRPPAERDYSRALNDLYWLVDHEQPAVVTVLQQLCRDAGLPKPVRTRAALLLSVARQAMPKETEPVLAELTAAHVLRRDGARWIPVD